MAWTVRKGLLVPKRRLLQPKHGAHPRANLILGYRHRQYLPPFFPDAPQTKSAIAVDATGTLSHFVANTTFTYSGITVGAGLANGALVVFATFSAQPGTTTATWDQGGTNQSMLNVVGAAQSRIFVLVNPIAGTKTLRLVTTNSVAASVIAQSYTGVLQTGGTTTWPNANTASASSTTPSVVVTSAIGNLPIAALFSAVSISSLNNTVISNAGGTPILGAQSAAGAASITFSGVTAGGIWLYSAVDMVAVAGAGGKIVNVDQAIQRAANW